MHVCKLKMPPHAAAAYAWALATWLSGATAATVPGGYGPLSTRPPWFTPPTPPRSNCQVCTVLPLGNRTDDVPQILSAFSRCNNGGTVVFPAGETYWIAQRLNPVLHDVTIQWDGTWLFSDDIDMWRNNTYHIDFQNHWTAFALSGERISIDGNGTGGINGNGNAWYDVEQKVTSPGRPMAFAPWNVTELVVRHCELREASAIHAGDLIMLTDANLSLRH
jgi:galacturan 1,4-alpha-galacturonidase